MNRTAIATTVAITALVGAGCTSGSQTRRDSGDVAAAEQQAVSAALTELRKSQPIPVFNYSQVLQTLIDVETAQAKGSVTTTAFYLEGIGMIEWCPSIGLPVASTSQLSNPDQYVDLPGDDSRELYPIAQAEPTGIFVGDSSGTYTLCVDDNGKPFAHYWEGYVSSSLGVRDYPTDKRVILTGDPTMQFGTGEG